MKICDQARHDRPVGEVASEGDAGEIDRVLGPLAGGDRPHERLVAPPQVCVHHVEVALADRHVDRFAHGAARVVQVRGQVGELHEVLEQTRKRFDPNTPATRSEYTLEDYKQG